ncbi:DUF1810 domain-containing protein [Altericroceibacterium xinjiangense]|uniref:DUF1810 domain-containing protein n=1 Tax=Altericroceibacterium xinjiangense TaxID=762261 RepID=UPI001F4998B9|nr:DUF1810 domain-containing protein [Altericroceibacterium xinjiangense]
MPGLDRFMEAQDAHGTYAKALAELREGHKRSHWMWFVFPQIAGLGRSSTAQFFAIADRPEAQAYSAHPVLAPRLAECTGAVLEWAGKRDLEAIFGSIDALKFQSSMTLFEAVTPAPSPFGQALDEFCGGERDPATLERL